MRMKFISQENLVLLHSLNGATFYSSNHNGEITIQGTAVLRGADRIDELDSNEKIQCLWDEYAYQEFLLGVAS